MKLSEGSYYTEVELTLLPDDPRATFDWRGRRAKLELGRIGTKEEWDPSQRGTVTVAPVGCASSRLARVPIGTPVAWPPSELAPLEAGKPTYFGFDHGITSEATWRETWGLGNVAPSSQPCTAFIEPIVLEKNDRYVFRVATADGVMLEDIATGETASFPAQPYWTWPVFMITVPIDVAAIPFLEVYYEYDLIAHGRF